MDVHVRTRILALTGAENLDRTELIQPLWNHYGTLSRVFLTGGQYPSVIVKHIQIPESQRHPRGFSGSISRERKIRSYQVETHWYQNQNERVPSSTATPRCIDAFASGGELFLLLEDLAHRGFVDSPHRVDWSGMIVVLQWLAHFHAEFVGDEAKGLWPSGTYWHLATRPEELAQIKGSELHRFASLLDARLRYAPFSTLVHGDAKLANFLFTQDRSAVAAVDFQYTGRGAAMKDVAYFIGSCLTGSECERMEAAVLDVYFDALRPALSAEIDGGALESEWRHLYPFAWADFQRFMQGWSPGHRKLTAYSDATTQRAIECIIAELLKVARHAARSAGEYIHGQHGESLDVQSKGFERSASDVLTEIDIHAQDIIMNILKPSIEAYDLGCLRKKGAMMIVASLNMRFGPSTPSMAPSILLRASLDMPLPSHWSQRPGRPSWGSSMTPFKTGSLKWLPIGGLG